MICWRWKPKPAYRSIFAPATVNTLKRMVRRHCQIPHRFLCITDDPVGLDADIEAVTLPPDFASLPSPHGGNNPSCYRRLRMFSPDFKAIAGDRFVSLDLDCVITRDVTALWDRPEDFIAWGDTSPRTLYNGSMILMTAGARRKVWDDFKPKTSPQVALAAGYWGSDQGWISYCLGKGEAKWTVDDGVYSFRNHLSRVRDLPKNARMVIFHGQHDPWSLVPQRLPWVREHYV